MKIKRAEEMRSYALWSIWGLDKTGKTLGMLKAAKVLAGDERIMVISTEWGNGDAAHMREVPHDQIVLNEDEDDIPIDRPFSLERFQRAVWQSAAAGYKAVIVDSATPLWDGPGGLRDLATDMNNAAGRNEKDITVWDAMKRPWQAFLDTLQAVPMHVFVTIQAKQHMESKADPKNSSRTTWVRGDMGPVMRDSFFYAMQSNLRTSEDFCLIINGTICDPWLKAFPEREIPSDKIEEAARIYQRWLAGYAQPQPARMSLVLRWYAVANLARIRTMSTWKQQVIGTALSIPKEERLQLSMDWQSYSDEETQSVYEWVEQELEKAPSKKDTGLMAEGHAPRPIQTTQKAKSETQPQAHQNPHGNGNAETSRNTHSEQRAPSASSQPVWAALYETGKEHGIWGNASAFYATVSTWFNGIVINKAILDAMNEEQLRALGKFIEDEIVAKQATA